MATWQPNTFLTDLRDAEPNALKLTSLFTPSWVIEVASTPEADLRAHRIALTYSLYAKALDDIVFDTRSVRHQLRQSTTPTLVNANWFHFATWGTLTVTQNIGSTNLPQRLNTGLLATVRRAVTPAVLRARAADGQAVGRALAWGQRLIFVTACLGFLELSTHAEAGTLDDAAADPSRLAAVDADAAEAIQELAQWDGCRAVDWQRHVYSVARAYSWMACAANVAQAPNCDPESDRERDAAASRLILGASVLLTAVEQDLVQAAIAVVINLVPAVVQREIEWRMARVAERVLDVPTQLSALALPNRHERMAQVVNTSWSRFMTDQVLVMALPTETLRLGRDIPPRRRGGPIYQADLARFPYPEHRENPVLKATADIADLVRSINRSVGEGHGTAARDWRNWDERMNWALALMRSRQHDATLFWDPYDCADRRRILDGELPQRAGDPSALQVAAPLSGEIFRGYREGAGLDDR